jgi:hypothetical protein
LLRGGEDRHHRVTVLHGLGDRAGLGVDVDGRAVLAQQAQLGLQRGDVVARGGLEQGSLDAAMASSRAVLNASTTGRSVTGPFVVEAGLA